MKKLYIFIACLCSIVFCKAQGCDVPISVAFNEESENMPEQAMNVMANKIRQILTANGVTGDLNYDQFVLIPRYDVIDKHIVAGPPAQIVYNLAITITIKDLSENKIFSTCSIDVDAVGQNETKAFIYGINRMSENTPQIQSCIDKARTKIVSYYDEHYNTIIQKAKMLAGLKKYDEALYHVISIPECCKSYSKAMKEAISLYKSYSDRNGEILLMQAKAIWAAGNNDEAAAKAAELLVQIDPEASCYGKANALLNEIKKKSSKNEPWNFEMKQYSDKIDIQKQQINAARAVGVAFGKGQKQTTTNLMFVR
jgi:hypothetical protein